jgi:hypothetical protein
MLLVTLIILAVLGLAIWLRPWPLFIASGEPLPPNGQPVQRNITGEFGKWVERQALARGLSVRGVARPIPLECPKCRKPSNYFVYPDELCERCWSASLKPITTPAKSNRL